ncbi:MAG: ParB/RepB/Spo0J family partition protein [Bacteroidales bacterium]|nr:ParB/RepB/Spo0J family partition protein [Bacteroidales bacterium]MDD3167447.1 ParB/RepB/Spo0J family partition protein [Bacteroidales bacterium]MDD4771344.1 ParB/RepB/Spo0J family partition protein [Bacteroidales bacterium]
MAKKNALGRGLGALLSTEEIRTEGSSSISEVELSQINPNPDQPRREFDQEALEDLATSIKTIGLIQPISLRRMPDGSYQIIAGERRYRAAKLAGITQLPAYVKTAEDDLVMEMALIENIQREDLNAIEIALAFQKLSEIYNLTQEKLSERLGKNRATIANYLRLLKLPAVIQLGLTNKHIDMGHARALVTIEDPQLQLAVYEETLKNGYSVRKVEEIARSISQQGSDKKAKGKPHKTPAEFNTLQKLLSKQLQTNVRFTLKDNGKGSINIPFASEKQLEQILARFDDMLRS